MQTRNIPGVRSFKPTVKAISRFQTCWISRISGYTNNENTSFKCRQNAKLIFASKIPKLNAYAAKKSHLLKIR